MLSCGGKKKISLLLRSSRVQFIFSVSESSSALAAISVASFRGGAASCSFTITATAFSQGTSSNSLWGQKIIYECSDGWNVMKTVCNNGWYYISSQQQRVALLNLKCLSHFSATFPWKASITVIYLKKKKTLLNKPFWTRKEMGTIWINGVSYLGYVWDGIIYIAVWYQTCYTNGEEIQSEQIPLAGITWSQIVQLDSV